MATFLLYVQFRTQVRGKVSAASRTARSQRCSRKNNNTSTYQPCCHDECREPPSYYTLCRATQDCMHTVRHGFVGYLARHVPSPPGHSMHFSQSSREGPSGIRSQEQCWVVHTAEHRIPLYVETRHFHPSGRRPSGSCMLSHRGCEPCTPPMHFNHTLDLSQKIIKLSPLYTDTD